MVDILTNWLINQGLAPNYASVFGLVGVALGVLLVALLANYIAKKVLLSGIAFLVRRTTTTWDDVLLKRKVFVRLSHIAPALVIYFCAGMFGDAQNVIERLSMVYMLVAGLAVINAFLNGIVDIYRDFEISRQKPIKGYIQVAKIVLFIFLGIVAVAVLMNKSPLLLLSGFGAMTAIILLLFKDSILGLVASIQLAGNDMVRLGDWIEMPKYGADGDVIDVSLTTVKVQNWDKTITTIPAYSLISDSFKNWRGMTESGGRRIKRALNLDMNSVRFCDPDLLVRLGKIQALRPYLEHKQRELEEFNRQHHTDPTSPVNGRNLTNIGTFRAYVVAYLKQHPKIRQDMTFLVRQLAPGPHGIPLEVYVFSNDQVWANYEAIQADIFDHLIAVVPEFGLRVFQYPTGADLQALGSAPPL